MTTREDNSTESPSNNTPVDDSLSTVSDSTLILNMDIKHEVERDVQRQLLANPALHFQSLHVYRTSPDSVCVQGVVELDETTTNLSSIIKAISCVETVQNRLVAQPLPHPCPK